MRLSSEYDDTVVSLYILVHVYMSVTDLCSLLSENTCSQCGRLPKSSPTLQLQLQYKFV